jgi:hypothetical protein
VVLFVILDFISRKVKLKEDVRETELGGEENLKMGTFSLEKWEKAGKLIVHSPNTVLH